ncbi:hypothetical protein [Bradyrhizobium vignae]|uniref:Tetratricopeptide repeat protein n=1 Tax=Bradyrhizobium vignae TaxID=1549949 RepID=A0ABS3ZSD5_9BRAD|nr:hypothetical protein [Bradyrhizobium vignae]MBP0111065.1 hypothetical protein [Bradyrhizobium vignae]
MSASNRGQAWYVLRGYRYQLLLSLDAWIDLRSDEILLLETEEDFSVESAVGAIDTQVKSSAATGGPIRAELANACSVLLDEGLNDQEAALGLIDAAISEIGSVPSLIRQKAKVLGHLSNDLAAAKLLMSIEDDVGAGSPLDRALALRDGGVSAARATLFADSLRLFDKAASALSVGVHEASVALGIKLESALVLWEMNDRPRAISMLANVLDAVEQLNPTGSRRNERIHQFARAVVGLFWRRLDPFSSGSAPNIVVGQASALIAEDEILGVELKPLADNWRILALCEIELGIDVGIESRSLTKQIGPGVALVEMFIARARYARSVVDEDNLTESFELGLRATFACLTTQETRENSDRALPTTSDSPEMLRLVLQSGLTDIIKTIPLDFMIWQRFRGEWKDGFIAKLEAACKAAWGDSASIADVISAASGRVGSEALSSAAALAAELAAMRDLGGSPRGRFGRDLLLVSHAAHSLARRKIEPIVVALIADGWSKVIAHETFALKAPLRHVPEMEAGLSDLDSIGLKAAARLLLAAAPAVDVSLPPHWDQLLRKIADLSKI